MGEREMIERLEEATLQWLELRDEENAALAQEASDAIASLTAALAEAEKKALERAAEAVRVLSYKQGTNSPAWIALRQAEDRIRNLSAPPRNLSQGGQHG